MYRTTHQNFYARPTAIISLIASLLITMSANGQTILYEDDFAAGIRNLRINNLCYDVQFVDGSYQSVFADTPPVFLNQSASANAAANEIRDILNSRRGVPEINESENEVLWIPNERVSRAEFRAAQVGHDESDAPWRRYGDVQGSVSEDYEPWDFARFSEGPEVVYAANTGHAVGINNLNLDGTCLDVRFVDGSYEEVFASHAPRYLGLELRGNNATNRIMNLMNAESAVPEINASTNEVLWIPTDRTRTTFEAEQVGHDESNLPWQRFGDFSGVTNAEESAWEFAVFEESLDCNRDGMVDIRDINCACGSGLGQAVLSAIDSMPGDLDGNGSVSFADFLKLSKNYGEEGSYTDGDLNCDGDIGFADFLILSENYSRRIRPTGPTKFASVPEPDGLRMALIMLPTIAFSVRRSRRLARWV